MSLAFPEPRETKPLTLAIGDDDYPEDTMPFLTIMVGPLDTFDDVLRKYEDALRQLTEGAAAP